MEDQEIIARLASAVSAGAMALVFYVWLIRPWHLRWGATRAEFDEQLPGDEIIPHPKHRATHAITIDAPLEDVWPWLVQVGQTRGGFYSYTWLENMVGCHMRNANRIVPEWQTLNVGDQVWLHPKAPPMPVSLVEPGHAIVLGAAGEGEQMGGTWGLYVKRIDHDHTRLIVRARWERNPGLLAWVIVYLVLEPAHFAMERRMLTGIKRRAEKLAERDRPSRMAVAVR
jgi:hypothetical protein